ncbi:hypothetical protein ACIQU4_07955 [Streptomyces sp. NPDC090741]|uniref:hypothetical protein n=1 Tax=Streptomyces sp. NPDC090741 TaxID=3365967 RepID=UPI00382872F5
MTRPALTEWETLDLTEDPTPGEPDILQRLADEYQTISDDAESALGVVTRVQNQEAGAGKSMEKLKETLDELPKQIGALRDSYEMATQAVKDYIPKLRDHQNTADIALANGKAAASRLASAIATAGGASAAVSDLDRAAPPPPDDETARRNARQAMDDAKAAERTAQAAVDSARSDLDAARKMAMDAKSLRETDASTAATAIGLAEDEAVKKKNFWDKLWDTIGSIFGIISAVLGVISFLIPGLQPLGLILGGISLVTGLVPLGINIARGVVTGDWDVVGIVLGVVGTAFGGFSIIKGAGSALSGILKGPKPTGGGGGGIGGAADDIPLRDLPPLPPSRGSGASSVPDGPPRIDVEIPSTGNLLDDIPHLGPGSRPPTPPGSPPPPTPPPLPVPPPAAALANNPGAVSAYLQSLVDAVRNGTAGAIGALCAFAGTFYGPIATAGQAPGAVVHGQPLVGNTNTDGT